MKESNYNVICVICQSYSAMLYLSGAFFHLVETRKTNFTKFLYI